MSVSKILNLLKPALHPPEIQDPVVVKQQYRYWRVRIFISLYLGYALYYFTRKSLAFTTPFLIKELHMSMADIGWIGTIFSVSYAISRFTSGILCDRSNPRYFMSIGLIITGICNIFFGFFSNFLLLALFWGLNGCFQGWGWPACAKQLTYWYSRRERGMWWSVCTTSHTVGGFLIAYIAAYAALRGGWQWGMFIPGTICLVAGFILMERLRDIPQSLGLPAVEKYKQEPLEKEPVCPQSEQVLSLKRLLFDQVLTNRYVWILSISYFFICLVRTAVNDWGMLYFVENKGFSQMMAAGCVSWFEVGGFFGIIVAGWGSDKLFQGKRVPMMVIYGIGLLFSVIGFWYLEANQYILASITVGALGFLVFGPQMLMGLAAAEFVSKKAASTSNGFACCFGYLGAAVAGGPLAIITEIWGWQGFFIALATCSVAVFTVLMPIWSATHSDTVKESSVLEEQPIVTVQTAQGT